MAKRITVTRIKLNRQGYEPGRYGRYYGVGEKLWSWEADGESGEFRAPDYAAARKKAADLAAKAKAKAVKDEQVLAEYGMRADGRGWRGLRGSKSRAKPCKYGKVKSGPRKGLCRLRKKR